MLAVLNQTTSYAPLRTSIDGDRDYSDLTGLGRCNCGYQGLDGLGRCNCGQGLRGLEGSGLGMTMLIGGVFAAWAVWALMTPHAVMEPVR